jgi:hypothetical protein
MNIPQLATPFETIPPVGYGGIARFGLVTVDALACRTPVLALRNLNGRKQER